MKIKNIITKSGARGWQSKLQDVYKDYPEFSAYCLIYGIHTRLNYRTPLKAWNSNPTIQGSLFPSDLRRMKNHILINGKRKTCKIYDMGDKINDRYTAVYRAVRPRKYGEYHGPKYWPYLSMNAAPFDPQGISQHGELKIKPGRFLGKRIAFDQLPEDCQKAIIQDLT